MNRAQKLAWSGVVWLLQIFIGAMIVHFFMYSVTILSQYGWTNAEVPS